MEAARVGRARQAVHDRKGTPSKKLAPGRGEEEIHRLGAEAELAVLKHFHLPWRNPVLKGGDPGWDMEVGKKTVQVKFTPFPWGRLLFDERRGYGFKAEVAVLVVPAGPEGVFRLVGWLKREEFVELAHEVDLGYGPCRGVWQHQLHPF